MSPSLFQLLLFHFFKLLFKTCYFLCVSLFKMFSLLLWISLTLSFVFLFFVVYVLFVNIVFVFKQNIIICVLSFSFFLFLSIFFSSFLSMFYALHPQKLLCVISFAFSSYSVLSLNKKIFFSFVLFSILITFQISLCVHMLHVSLSPFFPSSFKKSLKS